MTNTTINNDDDDATATATGDVTLTSLLDQSMIDTLFKSYVTGQGPGLDDDNRSLPSLDDLSNIHNVPIEALKQYAEHYDWPKHRRQFWFNTWVEYLRRHPVGDGLTAGYSPNTVEQIRPDGRPTTAGSGKTYKDEHGHFVRGNPGAPGKGHGMRTLETLRKRIFRLWEINPDAFEAAMAQLMLKAQAGDLEAIKFLFPYVLGKPDVNVNITGEVKTQLDLSELSDDELRQCVELADKIKQKDDDDGNDGS